MSIALILGAVGSAATVGALTVALLLPAHATLATVSAQVGREAVTAKIDDAQAALRDAWTPAVREGGIDATLPWPVVAADSFACAGGSIKDCTVVTSVRFAAVGGFADASAAAGAPQPTERDLVVRITATRAVVQAGKAPDVRATRERYVEVRDYAQAPFVTVERASRAAVAAAHASAAAQGSP